MDFVAVMFLVVLNGFWASWRILLLGEKDSDRGPLLMGKLTLEVAVGLDVM